MSGKPSFFAELKRRNVLRATRTSIGVPRGNRMDGALQHMLSRPFMDRIDGSVAGAYVPCEDADSFRFAGPRHEKR